MLEARDLIADRLRRQAADCAQWGSPFYGSLLDSAADDVIAGGPAWELLEGREADADGQVLGLRLMAAVHRLVLDESLPELSAHYPSTGGDGDATSAWPVFRRALGEQRETLRPLVARGCQTNEVGRSAALLGGFLEVAHRTGLPLRILELGSSAGFNLRWDRYRYESTEGAWGDATSPVCFTHSFEIPPPLNRTADVVERRGCDINPIDPTSGDGALTLRSFVWADQLTRLANLDGAIRVASDVPVDVEKIGAADFLERELSSPRDDVATVVFHSVFILYVDAEERRRIHQAIAGAGAFRLGFEPAEPRFQVRLDGEVLGTALPHGTGVRWNVDSTPT